MEEQELGQGGFKPVPQLNKSEPDLRLGDIAHTDWAKVQKGNQSIYVHYLDRRAVGKPPEDYLNWVAAETDKFLEGTVWRRKRTKKVENGKQVVEDIFVNVKTKKTADAKPPAVIAYENYLVELSKLRLNHKVKHDKIQKNAISRSPSTSRAKSWFEAPKSSLSFSIAPMKGSQFTPKAPLPEKHLKQMYVGGFDNKLGELLAVPHSPLSDTAEPRSPRRLFSELEEYPKIVAIAADIDFSTPIHMFTSRTRAEAFNEQLQNISSSCKVLMLHEAMLSPWINMFDPIPTAKLIYAKHPKKNRYLSVRHFHKTLLNEKVEELNHIMHNLGAKSVTWKAHWQWNRQYTSPAHFHPRLVSESELEFYHAESQWQFIVKERLQSWCDSANVSFTYEDDFGVNNWSVRAHFVTTKDEVVVKFFSRDEYYQHSLESVHNDWNFDNIKAFLRAVEMPHLIKPFEGTVNNGEDLLSLSSEDPVDIALRLKITLPEVEDLFHCIDDLSSEDNMELLNVIDIEMDGILQQKKHEQIMLKNRQAELPQQWQKLSGIVGGEFDVLLVGTRTVGKTSITESFQLLDFNQDIKPTVGIKPVQHTVGKSAVRFWDISGKTLELSSTILNEEMINVVLLVYDITDAKSLEWLRIYLQCHEFGPDCYLILLGNKLDLVEEDEECRDVYQEEAEELCEEFGVEIFREVSAKYSTNVHEAVADALLKARAPKKPAGLELGTDELNYNHNDFETAYMFSCCMK